MHGKPRSKVTFPTLGLGFLLAACFSLAASPTEQDHVGAYGLVVQISVQGQGGLNPL